MFNRVIIVLTYVVPIVFFIGAIGALIRGRYSLALYGAAMGAFFAESGARDRDRIARE